MLQRVLRSTQALLAATFFSGTTPTDADAAVTVTLTRGDGSSFAAGASTTHNGTGRYEYTLAPQATLERLKAVWTGTFGGVVQSVTTYAEIVGGYYVSLVDLKAESGLASKSDEELAEGRAWFEDKAERWCGVAFVPRYGRDLLDGLGGACVRVNNPRPRTILSAKVDGVVQTGTDTWDLYESGDVVRDAGSFTRGNRNVELVYEHGYDAPDGDLREAALKAIRARIVGSSSGVGIPAGVTQLTTDAGVYEFGRQSFPTGLPEVDSVLRERRVPLVA